MVTGLWGWETSLASCARAILSFFTPSRCVSSSQSSLCFLVFLCNPPGRDYTEFDVCHVEPGDSTLLRKQDRKNNSETSKFFFSKPHKSQWSPCAIAYWEDNYVSLRKVTFIKKKVTFILIACCWVLPLGALLPSLSETYGRSKLLDYLICTGWC